MKKILTLAAAAALLASCGNKNGYVIEGTIEGLDGMVYLLDEERNPIDSATVENGTFRLTGTAYKPAIMTLCDAPDETATFYAGLFIEPGTITVADDAENPMRKRVTGTPANNANAALTAASAARRPTWPASWPPSWGSTPRSHAAPVCCTTSARCPMTNPNCRTPSSA